VTLLHLNFVITLLGPRLHVLGINIQRHFNRTLHPLKSITLHNTAARLFSFRHRWPPLLPPKMSIPQLLRLLRLLLTLIRRRIHLSLLQVYRLHKPLCRVLVGFELRILINFNSAREVPHFLMGFGTAKESLGSIIIRCTIFFPTSTASIHAVTHNSYRLEAKSTTTLLEEKVMLVRSSAMASSYAAMASSNILAL